MTGEQIRELLEATPFRALELLLADGRVLAIAQPDLIELSGDGRLVKMYSRPDLVEIIDLKLAISVRFHRAGLFEDSDLET